MAKKQSETETPNTNTEVMVPGQTPPMLPVGFQTGPVNLGEGWEQKGLPPIIKPSMVPLGAFMQGTIEKAVPSTVASIKNPLLYLTVVDPASGQKGSVAFPVVATVGSAFGVRPGTIATVEDIEPFYGWQILLKKTGQAPAKKGQKRGAHLFQVWLKQPEAKAKK